MYHEAMDIKEEKINYKDGSHFEARLCRVRHIKPHYHNHDLELIFCISGRIRLVAGHQHITINAGEIFSVDYRDIHFTYSDRDNITLFLHLDLTKARIPRERLKCVFFACESSHCFPYQQEAMKNVKDLLLSLAYVSFANIKNEEASDTEHIYDQLLKILIKYFDWYNYENRDAYMNSDLRDRFYRILAYCNENFTEKLSISQIAESEHLSEKYIPQFFSKTVFHNFNNMIQYIRCYEAEHLLLTTDMSNSDISFACGFSDPKYFYMLFKKWWLCTPSEHRARYRKYMEKPPENSVISRKESEAIIKDEITNWHLKKASSLTIS